MATVLILVEQREGRLNRVSFETITAAQAIAKDTGWSLEAAVVGSDVSGIAAEVAKAKVGKVHAIECGACGKYTPDAYVAALKQFFLQHQFTLVLMPHTYQVRDFAPQLAASLNCTMIPDCIGYRYEGGKLVLTRQMFQGKFAADVSFAGEPPFFATFQA